MDFKVDKAWSIIFSPLHNFLLEIAGGDILLLSSFFTAFFLKKDINIKGGFLNFLKNAASTGAFSDYLSLSGAFTGIELGAVSVETVEINSVNRLIPYYYPTKVSVPSVTFRRGITLLGSGMWHWVAHFIKKVEIERRDVIVVHFARGGQVGELVDKIPKLFFKGFDFFSNFFGQGFPFVPVRLFYLYDCFPVSIDIGGQFDSLSSDITLELIEVQPLNIEIYDLLTLAAQKRLF